MDKRQCAASSLTGPQMVSQDHNPTSGTLSNQSPLLLHWEPLPCRRGRATEQSLARQQMFTESLLLSMSDGHGDAAVTSRTLDLPLGA